MSKAMVQVTPLGNGDPMSFDVTVREGDSRSRHRVTLGLALYHSLTAGRVSADRCIEAAFEFLLAREPKESILPRFDVEVIPTYFPEFEREIGRSF